MKHIHLTPETVASIEAGVSLAGIVLLTVLIVVMFVSALDLAVLTYIPTEEEQCLEYLAFRGLEGHYLAPTNSCYALNFERTDFYLLDPAYY